MSTDFAIIGGDLRMTKLAKMLAEEKNIVYIYETQKMEELKNVENIMCCSSIQEAIQNAKIIIAPIPLLKNKNDINIPFSCKEIPIQNLMSYCTGKILVAGVIKQEIYKIAKAKNVKIIDIMKKEGVAILNAISTAEGAIEVAISNTEIVLHKSKILILGFGRIAKILAKKLEALSVDVTCAARKEQDLAWIEAYGYRKMNINKLREDLSKYDIIFNTVPHVILDQKNLKYIKKETTIIELASNPGGINKIEAKKNGLKIISALGLPGKVAPNSAAEIIKDTIYGYLKDITKDIN